MLAFVFAAKIVVSSENAEPVALPLAKVKKRCTAGVSRLISATLAALPSGTAARRPRTDNPVGVTVLLVPSGDLLLRASDCRAETSSAPLPVELTTRPIS